MAHQSCIEKVQSALNKHHGQEVELELIPFVNLDSGDVGTDMAPLYYFYKDAKGKRKRGNLHLPRCPFCGKSNKE